MSTAATAHHRISDPFATAVAVLVIIAGATVLGVAASQSETTTPPPPTSTHGKVAVHSPSRVGMGDFNQTQPQTQPQSRPQSQPQRDGHFARLHGGESRIGLP